MTPLSELQMLRAEVDRIDEQILHLLNERARRIIEIGKVKRASDAEITLHTTVREAEIVERLQHLNTGPFPNEAIRPVYREIMSAGLSLEGPHQVAYLGPPATFTHMAAVHKFGASIRYFPVDSIKAVFEEVDRGRANFGVVPIENSTEGVVSHTLDLFTEFDVMIYGEVLQQISHHLLSNADRLEDIAKLYSHPHAVAQCRNWLESNLPQAAVIDVASTARAAELCATDPAAAAIASGLAAQLYDVKILKTRIEDTLNNYTRFLILSRKAPDRTGKDKTSIMLSTRDRVGALYDLLRPFASYGLNLTKIESRPSRRKAWEYIFFVDMEGHQDEDRVRKALEEVKSRCLFLKVLGSYPMSA